ncbi:hypothetical protein [Streptomyces sp. NPDC101132]|uniref:hypothetical protein n=1 Tax=Streptomyces sp. NPDC101132 TaxID=3366110 RepID=UPI0037F9C9B7
MPRPSRVGSPSPLFAFGAVLTAAGAAMYALPGYSRALIAVVSFAVAAVVAVWMFTRQR